jgi:hypothetical protein
VFPGEFEFEFLCWGECAAFFVCWFHCCPGWVLDRVGLVVEVPSEGVEDLFEGGVVVDHAHD